MANELQLANVLPIGITAIDNALNGGVLGNSTTVFAGKAGAGKTCAAMSAIAMTQGNDPDAVCIYLSAEGSFPLDSAKLIGVDLSRLLIIQDFNTAEEAMDQLFNYLWDSDNSIPRDVIKLAVIDSIAALVPKAEVDKITEDGMESMTIGLHARTMSKFNRNLRAKQGAAAVIMINQLRTDINSYGGGDKQTGGQTMYFDPKVILSFSAPNSKLLIEGTGVNKVVVGHTVCVKVLKNNAGLGGRAHQTVEYEVNYETGADNIKPTVEAAIAVGVIGVPGKSYYTIDGLNEDVLSKRELIKDGEYVKIHGMGALVDLFRKDEELYKLLQESIL